MGQKRDQLECDVAIVGAGPIGCLTAFRLYRAGVSVALIDRDADVGGLWRGTRQDGFAFDHGLHFIHQHRPWSESLFDHQEDCPVTEPVGHPLLYRGQQWTDAGTLTLDPAERPFLRPENRLVAGTMSTWLRSLFERHPVPAYFKQPLQSVTTNSQGIETGLTPNYCIRAKHWMLTGTRETYATLLPAAVLRTHAAAGQYQPAIVFQFALKKPVSDFRSVLILEQRMDHSSHRFLGLFESNLDSTRAPAGQQTCTWISFLSSEEFEDPAAITRWRRALKRSVLQAFPGMEEALLWERFLALPTAGGPVRFTANAPNLDPQWKNVCFLTHRPLNVENGLSWTSEQVGEVSGLNLTRF